ncbi:MAG: lipoyl synthase [bacterium]
MLKLPGWIKKDIPRKRILLNAESGGTYSILKNYKLNTVCQEAKCPNIYGCFNKKTATFMILGSRCTRSCKFCGVEKGRVSKIDEDEPLRIVEAAKKLDLKYVVITSVTRDDLPDGGARQFAKVIKLIREELSGVRVEVLVPDFSGDNNSIDILIDEGPDVFNHNIETVPRLYEIIRPGADYYRSLAILKYVKKNKKNIYTKSGLMLGLGEKKGEVIAVLNDLKKNKCDFITIGQYFKPGRKNIDVSEYITKDKFVEFENIAKDMGFLGVFSGTWVRSSFHAEEMMNIGARFMNPP